MPETLDPFLDAVDAAFEAVNEDLDEDDDPATTLLEYLSSAGKDAVAPPTRRSGRLVSLIVERDAH